MAAELATSLTVTEADRLLQAEAVVRGYCGWHIAPSREETVTMRGDGSHALTLESLHVTDVDEVTEDGLPLAVDVDYAWSQAGTLTRYRWGYGVVTVTFTHGHATVPAEVAGVVQAVAQRALDNPGSRPRDQVGPFAESFSQVGFNQAPALALLDAEKAILDRYRIPARP